MSCRGQHIRTLKTKQNRQRQKKSNLSKKELKRKQEIVFNKNNGEFDPGSG